MIIKYMYLYLIITTLIIAFCFCYLLYKKQNIEGFADVVPYYLHWNIFRCYSEDCVRQEGKKCYQWCHRWGEPGATNNCRMRCFDYADQMMDQLKFNDYTFYNRLPHFLGDSLLNDTDDYVMTRWYYPNQAHIDVSKQK